MNDLDYLNQISASTKQPAKTGFLDKKMKIVLGALGGVIVLVIILAIALGGSKTEVTTSSELTRLYTRASELSKTITTYNPSIRNSTLRSNGTKLSTLLTEIITNSSVFLSKEGVESKGLTISGEDAKSLSALTETLEKARLNGLLDRTYAHEMYYQISHLIIIEESIYTKTTDSTLKAFIGSSGASLEILEEYFKNYSESD